MIGHTRISKKDFYESGGMANPMLYRKMVNLQWQYYRMS
jgi:hypothetical protein